MDYLILQYKENHMKTRQFVFALCFLFLLNSPAQCVDIIIGTGTSSQVYPFAASYHDARSQIIYPANEIGASYKIKAISFDVTTAPCQNTTQYLHDFTIRMKHTPLNYYTSAVWESEDWTTVYNNSDCSIIGTGWKTFTLNIPFDYRRDQGNLMVDICFNNSSSLNNGQCRYTSKSTCRSIQYGSNSTDGDPLMWSGSTPSALIYGYMPNIKLTADLIPQLPTPTFSPNGGAYNTDKSAIVSCTEPDCVIHYTTNGEIPTEDDPVIASGSSIAIDRTMILKAKAWKAGYEPSSVKSANFDMVVEKLTFTPDSGTYQTEQNVTISCSTPGAEIHYTTSGVDPTEADATIVSGSTITVPVNPGITLKAIACRSGWYPSAVKSATYRLPLLFYVSTSGDDNNDGLSWLSAKKTIQSTINLALAGDDIWISKGEYTEKLSVNVPIGVYGGFAGTESLLTERPAFPRTALDLNETVINTSGSSGTAVSVNTGGSQRLTKIDGFTIKASGGSNYSGIECKYSIVEISNNIIRGNSSKGISLNYGSSVVTKNVISNNTSHGVYCSGNETITDNIIQDNGSYGVCSSDTVTIMRNVIAGNGSAGIAIIPSQPGSNPGTISGNMISGNNTGIYLQNGQIKISNNIISGNISTSGGGGIICNSPVLPVIVNNRIIGNKASNGDGGGISYHGSSFGIIANNVIAQNSCTLTGGGLFIHYSSPSVFSNTIVGNVANTQGGAISLSTYSNSTITIANNIFAFNSSGVYRSYGNAIVKNNCAFENAAYNYSNFTTDPTGTDGNFIADPKLASIANSNFHIQPAPDSPCVDTGDDTLAYGTSDIDGQARIINSGIDIGADESDGTFWSDELQQIIRVSTDGDDANDGSAWNLAKKTIQNAILAAGTTGGEVWVKAGLYTECISMCPDVYLYGGFNGTESSRDQRDWYLNETIINGGNMGNVVSIAGGGDGFGIDGFTIQNPVSSSFCINCSNASATISNNSIISSGDSIHITNSASVITDNTIVGQVYCKSSSPQISNNMISGGTKGIYCSGCLSGTISSNNITGNIGSGIECQGSLLTISNNFIHGNTSKNGAGIYCSGTDSPLIINNIITGNNATFTGGYYNQQYHCRQLSTGWWRNIL
jgi:parallel beta-helix repeat protein